MFCVFSIIISFCVVQETAQNYRKTTAEVGLWGISFRINWNFNNVYSSLILRLQFHNIKENAFESKKTLIKSFPSEAKRIFAFFF